MCDGQPGIVVRFGKLHHLKLEPGLGQHLLTADPALMAEAQAQGVMVVDDNLNGFLEQRDIDLTPDLQRHADVVVRQIRMCDLIEPDALLDRSQFVGRAGLRGQLVGRRIHLEHLFAESMGVVSDR